MSDQELKKKKKCNPILKLHFSSSHLFSLNLKLFSECLHVLFFTYVWYDVSHSHNLSTNHKTATENSNGWNLIEDSFVRQKLYDSEEFWIKAWPWKI